MDREIKFRGRSIETGEWVYGCLVNNMWTYSELSKRFKEGTPVCEIITGNYESDCWEEAITEESNIITVYPESVGQYTGLKDKNKKEIYEGDYIKYSNSEEWGIGEIVFDKGFIIYWKEQHTSAPSIMNPLFYFGCSAELEIVGNPHDNPELIEI